MYLYSQTTYSNLNGEQWKGASENQNAAALQNSNLTNTTDG
jgi:hypothetical protein